MIAPLVSKLLLLLLYHGYRGVSNSPFFPRRPFPVLAGRKSRVLFEHTHKADVSVIATYLGYLFHGQGSGGKVILPRLYPCRNDILVAADPELLFVHRLKIGRAEIYPVRQLPDGAKSPRIAVNIRSQLPQLLTVGVFAVTAFASALGYFISIIRMSISAYCRRCSEGDIFSRQSMVSSSSTAEMFTEVMSLSVSTVSRILSSSVTLK